jgi:RNA polymerase sigma factor (sigma-70 family)
MKHPTDAVLLARLKDEERASFEILYKFYFPTIASFVRTNSGRTEDAEDIFQETMAVLLHNMRQPGFTLTASLKTYVFAIARNLWLKRLRDTRRLSFTDIAKLEAEPFEHSEEPDAREEKVGHWLAKITEHCQRVLKNIFLYQRPMEDLMKKMGWKNKHTAANQQYKCLQQMKKVTEKEA